MTLIVAVFGLAVGSFLNVCIDRLPRGQSLLHPRSHCPACKTPLATRDLVPVLSYLRLRGKCRYCSAPIPKRVLFVEAGTGLLFVLLWNLFGVSPRLGLLFLLFWGLYGASPLFLLAVVVACALVVAFLIGLARRQQKGVRDGVRR